MFAVTAEDTCVTLADSEVSTTLSGDSIIRAKLERAEHMKSEFPPKPESDRVVDAGTRKTCVYDDGGEFGDAVFVITPSSPP